MAADAPPTFAIPPEPVAVLVDAPPNEPRLPVAVAPPPATEPVAAIVVATDALPPEATPEVGSAGNCPFGNRRVNLAELSNGVQAEFVHALSSVPMSTGTQEKQPRPSNPLGSVQELPEAPALTPEAPPLLPNAPPVLLAFEPPPALDAPPVEFVVAAPPLASRRS